MCNFKPTNVTIMNALIDSLSLLLQSFTVLRNSKMITHDERFHSQKYFTQLKDAFFAEYTTN